MYIKDKDAIAQIKKGGKILGSILQQLGEMCKVGVSLRSIDKRAEQLILKADGRPAFKGYRTSPSDSPFPSTICASLNQELVHASGKRDIKLKNGDIFSIDIGMEYPHKKNFRGFYTDTALTVIIGKVDEKVKKLLEVTQGSLCAGIKASRAGNSVSDISKAVENYVKSQGKYGIVRDLVGHGVGYEVHEEPRIPNFHDKYYDNFVLKPGMVIAIEPMVSLGGYKVKTGPDGWAIEMADNSLCAHFEHTVIITDNEPIVATRRSKE